MYKPWPVTEVHAYIAQMIIPQTVSLAQGFAEPSTLNPKIWRVCAATGDAAPTQLLYKKSIRRQLITDFVQTHKGFIIRHIVQDPCYTLVRPPLRYLRPFSTALNYFIHALSQVVQYLPNFFFAALLMLLGVEITLDWLILSARKVSGAEYALLLATFLSILQGAPRPTYILPSTNIWP